MLDASVRAPIRQGDIPRLGAGFGLAQSTAYRYLDEVVDVLASQAPGLQQALERALTEGTPYLILDGKVVDADRCREKTVSRKGKTIDLWYSGKTHDFGGNIQALFYPSGIPLWVSDVLPGNVHDLAAAQEYVTGAQQRGIDVGALAALDVRGRAVLLHTGDGARFGTADYAEDRRFLTQAGAAWLAGHDAALVGIDALNIDDTADGERPAHTLLLAAGIPVVEHLTGLEQLPGGRLVHRGAPAHRRARHHPRARLRPATRVTPKSGSRHPVERHTGVVRIALWVRPGSARPGVGGEHNGALVVRVSAPAVGGQATEAALTAVAAALGVRRHAVTLIAGASSRTKIVQVEGADPGALNRLLANAGHGNPT